MSVLSQSVSTIVLRECRVNADYGNLPALTEPDVHVWHQRLDLDPGEIERFRSVLSPDELDRARRFRFDSNRNEFIVARGTVRTLLGSYLDISPASLQFAYSQYGRPSLVPVMTLGTLQFNVTHSGNVALFAFARDRRIGIDVERVRRDFSTVEIAERFFSQAERVALRELPEDQRHEAFFRCWTRKEAFIKALGEGLSHPLDQFDVSLAPAVPAALLATRPDEKEAMQWKLWDVQIPGDYAAALAAESMIPSM